MTATTLTAGQWAELRAIARTRHDLGKPTSLWAGLYHDPDVGGLVRRGLITWDRHHPDAWGPNFRAVEPTAKGYALLKDKL